MLHVSSNLVKRAPSLALLFMAFTLGGCDRFDGGSRNVVATLTSDVVPTDLLSDSIYWLDEQHVIFEGAPRLRVGSGSVRDIDAGGIYVWDVVSGSLVQHRKRATALCFDGTSIFYVLWEPTSEFPDRTGQTFEVAKTVVKHGKAERWSGAFGHEAQHSSDEVMGYSRVSCEARRIEGAPSEGMRYSLREPNSYLLITRDVNGFLRAIGSDREIPVFSRPGEDPSQFRIPDISYSAFRTSYFVSWPSIAALWPDSRAKAFVFDAKGKSEAIDIDVTGLPGVMTFDLGAAGPIIRVVNIVSSHDAGKSGVYLATTTGPKLLRQGHIKDGAVSPDGCRYAYARGDDSTAFSERTGLEITLEVLNVCQ